MHFPPYLVMGVCSLQLCIQAAENANSVCEPTSPPPRLRSVTDHLLMSNVLVQRDCEGMEQALCLAQPL